jgi:ribosomal protein S18 acetylase RimI-like enzyme
MSFEILRADTAQVRAMTEADAQAVGAVIYHAIGRIFRDHGQPEPIADEREGERLARLYLELDPEGALVVEREGTIAGAGFVHVRDEVASLGPVVVDPRSQGQGIGKVLVDRLTTRAVRCASTRLLVDAFNMRAIGIVLKRSFVPRDHGLRLVALGGLRGPGMMHAIEPAPVRELTAADLDPVALYDSAFFGGSRHRDFRALLAARGVGLIAEEGGAVRGYLFGRLEESLAILGPGSADSPELMAQLLARLGERIGSSATIVLTYLFASQVDVVREAFAMGFRATSLGLYMVQGAYTPLMRPAVIGLPPDVV